MDNKQTTDAPNPKTISYKRQKKVNPGLVNPRFEYMSESFEFLAWEDIDPAEDTQAAYDRLVSFIDQMIQNKTEEIVTYYREISRSQIVPLESVRTAFYNIAMQNGNTEDVTETAWNDLQAEIAILANRQTA